MPSTGSPWNIWYPDDTSPVAPLENLFLTQATSVATALSGMNKIIDSVADLAAVAAVTGMQEGDLLHIDEGDYFLLYTESSWKQVTTATFASSSARDTAYAKASAAYRVQGARVYRTDVLWIEEYFAIYNSGSNPSGTPAAGWYPVSGQLPYSEVVRASGDSARTGATWTIENSGSVWSAGARRGGFAAWAGSFVVPIAGVYDIHAFLYFLGGNTPSRLMFTKNNASANQTGCIAQASGNYIWDSTAVNISAKGIRLASGDEIRLLCFPNSNETLKGSGTIAGQHIAIEYVAPPVGV